MQHHPLQIDGSTYKQIVASLTHAKQLHLPFELKHVVRYLSPLNPFSIKTNPSIMGDALRLYGIYL